MNAKPAPFSFIEYSLKGESHTGYILRSFKKDPINVVFVTDKGHQIYRQNIKSVTTNALSKSKSNKEILLEVAGKLKLVGLNKAEITQYRHKSVLYGFKKKVKEQALKNALPYLKNRLGLLTLDWEEPLF